VELVNEVHKGDRPPINKLSPDLDPEVISIIESCWSSERSKRLTAIECKSVLERRYILLSDGKFDIFFSHKSDDKPMLQHVYNYLSRSGYKVWYDKNNIQIDLEPSMIDGITNSDVFVACVNRKYQSSPYCMFELEKAIEMKKPIVCVVLEELPSDILDDSSWATPEFSELCQFSAKKYANLVDVAKLAWTEDDEPKPELLDSLRNSLHFLVKLLKDLKCYPSLRHLKNASHTAFELKSLGKTAADVKGDGYTLSEMKEAGYTIQELKEDADFELSDFKSSGYTCGHLKHYFIPAELKSEFTAKDFKE
jgi:hypothetical protein